MIITPVVSAQWLNDHINDSELIVLDASQPVNATAQIFGARTFDIKNVFSDLSNDLPNTFPSTEQFENEAQKLGINQSSKLIVYDSKGIFSSPRVWWMFKSMGYQNIAVLDGGLPEWAAQGYETTSLNPITFEQGNFKAHFHEEMITNHDFVKTNISKKEATVIDARSTGRFNGTTEEPRKGLRGGNIPNSLSLPYSKVLNNGKFKSKEELTTIFNELNLNSQQLVFTCGSGITACIILLASELVCIENKKSVYDGSWTEWAQLNQQ